MRLLFCLKTLIVVSYCVEEPSEQTHLSPSKDDSNNFSELFLKPCLDGNLGAVKSYISTVSTDISRDSHLGLSLSLKSANTELSEYILANSSWSETDFERKLDFVSGHQLSSAALPIMMALVNGNAPIVQELAVVIRQYLDPKEIPLLLLPFQEACSQGHTEAVRAALDADLVTPEHSRLVIHSLNLAIQSGSIELVKLLVAHIEKLRLNSEEVTLLQAARNQDPKMIEFLTSGTANLKFSPNKWNTALYLACQKGYLEVVKAIDQSPTRPEGPDLMLSNCLALALFSKHTRIVEYLTKKNVSKAPQKPATRYGNPLTVKSLEFKESEPVSELLENYLQDFAIKVGQIEVAFLLNSKMLLSRKLPAEFHPMFAKRFQHWDAAIIPQLQVLFDQRNGYLALLENFKLEYTKLYHSIIEFDTVSAASFANSHENFAYSEWGLFSLVLASLQDLRDRTKDKNVKSARFQYLWDLVSPSLRSCTKDDFDEKSIAMIARIAANLAVTGCVKSLVSVIRTFTPDVLQKRYEIDVAFQSACQHGDFEIVKLLDDHSLLPVSKTALTQSLLLAAQEEHSEIMKVLLRHKEKFDDSTTDKLAEALGICLNLNSDEGIAALIESKLLKGSDVQKALEISCYEDHADVAKIIITKWPIDLSNENHKCFRLAHHNKSDSVMEILRNIPDYDFDLSLIKDDDDDLRVNQYDVYVKLAPLIIVDGETSHFRSFEQYAATFILNFIINASFSSIARYFVQYLPSSLGISHRNIFPSMDNAEFDKLMDLCFAFFRLDKSRALAILDDWEPSHCLPFIVLAANTRPNCDIGSFVNVMGPSPDCLYDGYLEAIRRGNPVSFEYLFDELDGEFDKYKNENFALMYAIRYGRTKMVKKMLSDPQCRVTERIRYEYVSKYHAVPYITRNQQNISKTSVDYVDLCGDDKLTGYGHPPYSIISQQLAKICFRDTKDQNQRSKFLEMINVMDYDSIEMTKDAEAAALILDSIKDDPDHYLRFFLELAQRQSFDALELGRQRGITFDQTLLQKHIRYYLPKSKLEELYPKSEVDWARDEFLSAVEATDFSSEPETYEKFWINFLFDGSGYLFPEDSQAFGGDRNSDALFVQQVKPLVENGILPQSPEVNLLLEFLEDVASVIDYRRQDLHVWKLNSEKLTKMIQELQIGQQMAATVESNVHSTFAIVSKVGEDNFQIFLFNGGEGLHSSKQQHQYPYPKVSPYTIWEGLTEQEVVKWCAEPNDTTKFRLGETSQSLVPVDLAGNETTNTQRYGSCSCFKFWILAKTILKIERYMIMKVHIYMNFLENLHKNYDAIVKKAWKSPFQRIWITVLRTPHFEERLLKQLERLHRSPETQSRLRARIIQSVMERYNLDENQALQTIEWKKNFIATFKNN